MRQIPYMAGETEQEHSHSLENGDSGAENEQEQNQEQHHDHDHQHYDHHHATPGHIADLINSLDLPGESEGTGESRVPRHCRGRSGGPRMSLWGTYIFTKWAPWMLWWM